MHLINAIRLIHQMINPTWQWDYIYMGINNDKNDISDSANCLKLMAKATGFQHSKINAKHIKMYTRHN